MAPRLEITNNASSSRVRFKLTPVVLCRTLCQCLCSVNNKRYEFENMSYIIAGMQHDTLQMETNLAGPRFRARNYVDAQEIVGLCARPYSLNPKFKP